MQQANKPRVTFHFLPTTREVVADPDIDRQMREWRQRQKDAAKLPLAKAVVAKSIAQPAQEAE